MRTSLAASLGLILGLLSSLPAGTLETRDLESKILKASVKLNVVLPDGYAESGERRYPVVYLLHGLGGDYGEWQRVGVVERAAGLDVILALPEGDKSFYINHHEKPGARWEDYIVEEVIPFVDGRYRTLAQRGKRGISGLSMGGYGAMVLGLRHPELFASAASHSGALEAAATKGDGQFAAFLTEIFGPEDSATRKRYDPLRLAADLPAEKRPHLYIDCGSSDLLLESNRAFVAHLAKEKVPYEYREVPGGHTFEYWKRNVRYSLERQLEAFAASPPDVPAAAGVASGASNGEEDLAKAIIGEWSLVVEYGEEKLDYGLVFKKEGESLKAVLVSPRSGEHPFKSALLVGKGRVKLVLERKYDFGGDDPITFEYNGALEGGKLSGKITSEDFPEYTGAWTAERKEPQKSS